MPIIRFTYTPTNEELRELETAVRLKAAQTAGIDHERLTVRVLAVVGYQVNEDPPYYRADRAEITIDGRTSAESRKDDKIRWYVQQTMIGLHRVPDRSRMRPMVDLCSGANHGDK